MTPVVTAPGPAAWTALDLHADVVGGVAAIAAVWLVAWRRRGEPVSLRHAARFFGALGVVLLALNGPVHALAERALFSAHMVQHLALTLVLPPLALTGTPGWMVDAVLAAPRAQALGAVVRAVTGPLPALAVWTVALGVWHLPGPYDAALETHAWHVIQHISLIAASLVAWWPVLSPSRVAPPLPYGAQILYLFVLGMPMTVVAAMVTGADDLLYRFYAEAPQVMGLSPLEDQRLGGALMWVPAGLVPLVAFTVVFFRWAAAEAEDRPEPP
jgi:putative membrane protein